MVGHGAKFGRKKEAAIAALLTSRNVEEAAKTIGVGTNTLLRWLEIPEFKKAYLGARRKAVSQAIARVQQTTGPAVSTLQKSTQTYRRKSGEALELIASLSR